MSTPNTTPQITEHGIVWPRRALNVQTDIRPLATEIASLNGKSVWGLTDLAVWWSDHSTEQLSILASWLHVPTEYLYDRISTGRAWPIAERDTESDYLTFGHYRALQSYDRETRLRWLARVAEERIPVNQLRAILRGEANANGDIARTAHAQRVIAAQQQRAANTRPVPAAVPINDTLDQTAAPVGIALAETPVAHAITTEGTQNGARRIVLSAELTARIYAAVGDNYTAAVAMAEQFVTQGLDARKPLTPQERKAAQEVGVSNGRFGRIEVA